MKPVFYVDASRQNEAEEVKQAVTRGVMSPRSADSVLSLMGAEFEQQTIEGFSTGCPEWSLIIAVLHISWRHLTTVEAELKRYQRWTYDLWQDPFESTRQVFALSEAELILKNRLVTGIVRGFGTNKEGMCRRIADEKWESLSFYKPPHANQDQWSAVNQEGALEYEDVFVIRDELLSIFPEINHAQSGRELKAKGEASPPAFSAAASSSEAHIVDLGQLPLILPRAKRGRGRPTGTGHHRHDIPIAESALALRGSGVAKSLTAAVRVVKPEVSDAQLRRVLNRAREIENSGQKF